MRAERARHHVAVQVIHRHERQLAGGGKSLRGRQAHQQRADQAGTARDGNGVDVVEPSLGALERVRGDGIHEFQVVARGDLGDHAAVARMQQSLGRDHVRRNLAVTAHDRCARVVAARLEGEDHAVVRSSTVRHMMSASSRLSW